MNATVYHVEDATRDDTYCNVFTRENEEALHRVRNSSLARLNWGTGALGPRCCFQGRIIAIMRGYENLGGSSPPLPTKARFVSWRARIMVTKREPDMMVRNQNIHHQPAPAVRAPPITGPRLGAVVILRHGAISLIPGNSSLAKTESVNDCLPKRYRAYKSSSLVRGCNIGNGSVGNRKGFWVLSSASPCSTPAYKNQLTRYSCTL
jgi:hypothetical protein